jgi:hypothetical protein
MGQFKEISIEQAEELARCPRERTFKEFLKTMSMMGRELQNCKELVPPSQLGFVFRKLQTV